MSKKKTLLSLLLISGSLCARSQSGPASLIDSSKQQSSCKQPHQRLTSFIAPSLFLSYGLVSLGNNPVSNLDHTTYREMNESHPGFNVKVDNYLQYGPAILAYGLNAAGIKGKNNFRDRTMIFALSNLFSCTIVTTMKNNIIRERPDGSNPRSFPSGHTATAFASAEFLHQEYRSRSFLYSAAGYLMAGGTGALRMYNEKHFLSDIIAGAGIGIISTKVAYLVYPFLQKKLFGKKIACKYSHQRSFQ